MRAPAATGPRALAAGLARIVGAPDVATGAAVDERGSFCPRCRACEPVRPAGVPYGQLVEVPGDTRWQSRRRLPRIRPLLRCARSSRRLMRLLGRLRPRRHAPFTPPAADGEDRLPPGCFERSLFPRVSRAAAGTLPGVRVPPDQGCCAAPRQLLAALGEYVEIPGAGDRCGAAGTCAVLCAKESRKVPAEKMAAPRELDLDCLAVVNPGCQRQLVTAVSRSGLRTRVPHVAERVELAHTRAADR